MYHQDLLEYQERVTALRLACSNEVIFNNSHSHAAVLIENLFLTAQDNVRILCSNLNNDVYGSESVIKAAEYFLLQQTASGQKPQLHIIIESGSITADNNDFLKTFGAWANVSVKHCASPAPTPFQSSKFNFMVSDEIAYRFEEDRDTPSAIACFNSPKSGRNLCIYFDDLSSHLPN